MLDIRTVNEMSQEEIASWIHRRLHGKDPQFPLDPGQSDYWHTLLAEAFTHPQVSDATRRNIRVALLDISAGIRTYPSDGWTDSAAVEEFLFLAPALLNDSEFEDEAARNLRDASNALPYLAKDGRRLKGLALLALIEMRRPMDAEFWKHFWNPKHADYAAVIFEGLELTSVEAAFAWLGSIRPWRAPLLVPCLESLLPGLIEDYGCDRVRVWIEEKMLPAMKSETARAAVREVCASHELEIWQRFDLPLVFWNLYLGCLHHYRKLGTESVPIIYCGGGDASFLQIMMEAFTSAVAEIPVPASKPVNPAFPTLVSAYLRSAVPEDQLENDDRFEKAQDKDAGRKLLVAI